MKKRTVIIIQARMTSTRLPGKVLAELEGMPMLAYMLRRVKKVKKADGIVVAMTVNKEDDPVAALCDQLDVVYFRGDEHNVLDRFYCAAKKQKADYVIRLTADCPIIDPTIIDEVIALFHTGGYEYVSNTLKRTYPDGLDVEMFSFEALERTWKEAEGPLCKEHVTPFMYKMAAPQGKKGFTLGCLENKENWGKVRWTVDTQEDLDRIRLLCQLLPEGFSWEGALAVAKEKPHLLGTHAYA